MKSKLKSALFATAAWALSSTCGFAAYTFNQTDMVLGFQVSGDTGVTQNLFLNLGESTDYRDGLGNGFKGNISTSLVDTFGADWFTRTDLFVGAAANRTGFTSLLDPPVGNQDGGRTFYATKLTAGAGMSSPIPGIGGSALAIAGNEFGSLRNIFPDIDTLGDGAGRLDQTDHPVAWNNSWAKWAPTAGTSFTAIPNIHATFGTGETVLLDIQRLTTNQAGTYVATISIDSLGNVNVIPEPSTLVLSGLAAVGLVLRRRR